MSIYRRAARRDETEPDIVTEWNVSRVHTVDDAFRAIGAIAKG